MDMVAESGSIHGSNDSDVALQEPACSALL